MLRKGARPYQNVRGVLTSMHGKERVIAPILRSELGLNIEVVRDVDTDQFGTFSREVERTGSQLDAARAKISAGFDHARWANVGLASEGSFGPHPYIPLVAIGRELVLLVDRASGLELAGYDATLETNFAHAVVRSTDCALAFAERAGFPEHGLIVMGCREEKPAPDRALNKDVASAAQLEAAVEHAIGLCGSAFVETDMRAHHNPMRMAAIARATRDLARRFHCRCPHCDQPGFDVVDRLAGMPCAWCGEPTSVVFAEVLACRSCGHSEERSVAADTVADPGQCTNCNP